MAHWDLVLLKMFNQCCDLCSDWFVNRKLLHQRVEGKEVSGQEENFLPKHQRVKDLCQRSEYQTPCQQTGQVRHTCFVFVKSQVSNSEYSRTLLLSLILYSSLSSQTGASEKWVCQRDGNRYDCCQTNRWNKKTSVRQEHDAADRRWRRQRAQTQREWWQIGTRRCLWAVSLPVWEVNYAPLAADWLLSNRVGWLQPVETVICHP